MNIIKIIEKKRDKKKLSEEEIIFFIDGYTGGSIPDYQASALLMAIFLNDLDAEETFYLTKAMLATGEVLKFDSINKIKVDKHSTGGVGDKTTLVLAPILASLGLAVPKMSGRSLGHTGGTIDKLESIPNFKVDISTEKLLRQMEEINVAIIGQSENIALADKKLYALRDVSGTINSIPLIASSIMSKKLALGADIIALDVKVGGGAFVKTMEEGRLLAESMVAIGAQFGKKVIAFLTEMNCPLGDYIGNSLEVIEAVAVLKGKGNERFRNFCIDMCSEIILKAAIAKDKSEALKLVKDVIYNQKALEKFVKLIEAQGGDQNFIYDYNELPLSKSVYEVKSAKDGYVNYIDSLILGEVVVELGGGRKVKGEAIDHSVGIKLEKQIGEKVLKGDCLAKIYYKNNLDKKMAQKVESSIVIDNANDKPKNFKLIKEVIM